VPRSNDVRNLSDMSNQPDLQRHVQYHGDMHRIHHLRVDKHLPRYADLQPGLRDLHGSTVVRVCGDLPGDSYLLWLYDLSQQHVCRSVYLFRVPNLSGDV